MGQNNRSDVCCIIVALDRSLAATAVPSFKTNRQLKPRLPAQHQLLSQLLPANALKFAFAKARKPTQFMQKAKLGTRKACATKQSSTSNRETVWCQTV